MSTSTKSGQEPDLELTKAFIELQQKTQETNQKLHLADVQIEQQKRRIQHSLLTDKEIEALPKETRTFEGVGRMFVLRDIAEIRKSLSGRIDASENKIKTLQTNKEYLERTLKDSENNLRELVKLKQGGRPDSN